MSNGFAQATHLRRVARANDAILARLKRVGNHSTSARGSIVTVRAKFHALTSELRRRPRSVAEQSASADCSRALEALARELVGTFEELVALSGELAELNAAVHVLAANAVHAEGPVS